MAMTETPKGEVWKITVTATYAERWLSGLKKLCRIMRLHTLTLPEEKTIFVCGDEGTALVRSLASLAARFPKELRIRRFDLPKRMRMRFEWEKPSFSAGTEGWRLKPSASRSCSRPTSIRSPDSFERPWRRPPRPTASTRLRPSRTKTSSAPGLPYRRWTASKPS